MTGSLFSDPNARTYLMIEQMDWKFQIRKVKFRLEKEGPLTELGTFSCFHEYFYHLFCSFSPHPDVI